MYGLIHISIRQFVEGRIGETAWESLARDIGVDESNFVTMQAYPDEVTLQLVAAGSEALALSQEEFLHDLGVHWVKHTAAEFYGPLLEFAGSDVASLLQNLNRMHDQVAISFSNLVQPSFELEPQGEGEFRLHYRSSRSGLSSFVTGLLAGLGDHFNESVSVRQVEAKLDGDDHDVFVMRIGPGAST